MSHFLTYIVVPKKEDDRFNEYIADVMSKFDENMQVEEYFVKDLTDEDKIGMINYLISDGSIDDSKTIKDFDEIYKMHGEDWNSNKWRLVDGIWKEYSTYNPNSKWDWYSIGGRWNNNLVTKSDNKVNIAYKKDVKLSTEIIPFAIIKDGHWIERGQMGWFAMVTDEKNKDEWDNEFYKIWDTINDDDLIVVLDCHI